MAEAEANREQERTRLAHADPKLVYDYEGRFIKQRLERDRVRVLPRVVKPPMFAPGGHALGDLRAFDRYAVGPLSSMTCSFLSLGPGERSERMRTLQPLVAFVLEGAGVCLQQDRRIPFGADDVVVVPPYTEHQFVADAASGLRAWVPQTRFWHVLGLLWREQFEFRGVPEGTVPLRDAAGGLLGFRVPTGQLGLTADVEVRGDADPRRSQAFAARRAVGEARADHSAYGWFLDRLAAENREEASWPRVIRGDERPWERTRQGRLKFYISHWTEVAARDLDLMVYDIAPGDRTGRHRHIFEELLLVVRGRGHDVHDGVNHAWEAGDLVCVPMMVAHEHVNDGSEPARLVSVWPRIAAFAYLGGIEQLSEAPSWRS